MVVIRVSGLRTQVEEKQLRTYFKNPKNGGGYINAIYYPLKFNEAVVVLQDEANSTESTKILTTTKHVIVDDHVVIRIEPDSIFDKITATMTDPGICNLLQRQSDLYDELKFGSDLEITYTKADNSYLMQGNMYQIEWAWNYLHFQVPRKHRITSASSFDGGYLVPQSQSRPKLNIQRSQTEQGQRRVSLPTNVMTDRPPAQLPPPVPSVRESNSPDYDEVGSLSFKDNPLWIPPDGTRPAATPNKRSSMIGVRVLPSPPGANVQTNMPASTNTPYRAIGVASPPGANVQTNRPASTNTPYRSIGVAAGPKSFVIGNKMTITIEYADITKSTSAALAISTDPDMNNSTGTALLIANKAGKKFRDECAKIISYRQQLSFCDVVHTCAGGELNSKVKHVIQLCVPPWNADNNLISQHKLVETYCRLLMYADETLKVQSMMSTFLGTNKLSIPIGVTVSAFLDAVHMFLSKSQNPPRLREVRLVSTNDTHVLEAISTMECFGEMKFNDYLTMTLEKYDDALLEDIFPKIKPDGSRDQTDTETVYVKLSRLSNHTR